MLERINPTTTDAWHRLERLSKEVGNTSIRTLFENDPDRFEKYSIEINQAILLDYSKNKITDPILGELLNLAEQTKLKEGIESMYSGKVINETENRSVLHTALRNPREKDLILDGVNLTTQVHDTLDKLKHFVRGISDGTILGYTGKQFTDIVNIGIGGSDLGPVMVTEALKPYWQPGIEAHFISNVDGSHLHQD